MKDTRRDSEVLTVKTMASFVRDEYHEWLEGYVEGKKDTDIAYESLLRLLGRFAYHLRFVHRTPSGLKENLSDLITVRDDFAKPFKETNSVLMLVLCSIRTKHGVSTMTHRHLKCYK
ncbi:hypothetical protein JG687_00012062 [Phytophthora cactorum]|uniref:Uncharacterized protein n=1 Tax=Phytophthora cactorum TaxID=29920 RepID=A0A8T1U303_9STRA|nr:hypothetical protein JG687_00012062 [Phytophthora cactorum]